MNKKFHLLSLDSFALLANNKNVRMIYNANKKLIRVAVRKRGMAELALVLVDKEDLDDGDGVTEKEGINVRKVIVTQMWNDEGKSVEINQDRVDNFVEGLK